MLGAQLFVAGLVLARYCFQNLATSGCDYAYDIHRKTCVLWKSFSCRSKLKIHNFVLYLDIIFSEISYLFATTFLDAEQFDPQAQLDCYGLGIEIYKITIL